MRALAIVPAYNEALNIARVVQELRLEAPQWDVCVVDDGSTDDTARIARESGAVVLRLPVNLGIGGAVQTGYLWAREHGYQVAAQIDGDGQHDPRYLAAALEPIARRTPVISCGALTMVTAQNSTFVVGLPSA